MHFCMNAVALTIGLSINLLSMYLNRRTANGNSRELNFWNGWVTAMTVRFSGIIISAFFAIFLESIGNSTGRTGFMIIVLITVLTGLFADMVISIKQIHKINKGSGL